MKNKKAVSISILLLVVTSLIISIISLSYFISKDRSIEKIISVSDNIDQIYLEENLLNFYLEDIFDKSIKDFKFEEGKYVFIDNFKNELESYKDKNGNYPVKEMEEVEKIALMESFDNSVELSEERIVLKLNLEIRESYVGGEVSEGGKFIYNYEKSFEKVFK